LRSRSLVPSFQTLCLPPASCLHPRVYSPTGCGRRPLRYASVTQVQVQRLYFIEWTVATSKGAGPAPPSDGPAPPNDDHMRSLGRGWSWCTPSQQVGSIGSRIRYRSPQSRVKHAHGPIHVTQKIHSNARTHTTQERYGLGSVGFVPSTERTHPTQERCGLGVSAFCH
jgi:hypothetical protein